MTAYFAELAWLTGGWARDVRFEIADGTILSLEADSSPLGAERCAGPVVPGFINLHSHAFQRALVGLTEHTVGSVDTFWTWRETMYALAARFTPESLQTVARQLYIELLRGGYTSVAEFHYLHAPAPTEMTDALLNAMLETGIRGVLLPSLYQHGGIGGRPLEAGQRPFALQTGQYMALCETVQRRVADHPRLGFGFAPHSLRAVTGETLNVIAAAATRHPLHLHVAEQRREVEAGLEKLGATPLTWLLEHHGLNERWCLIHATHATAEELRGIAQTCATVGLCPATEGNLGDGHFNLTAFVESSGAFGIGSDSQICLDPTEELRWLEYGQRLRSERRNLIAGSRGSSGAALIGAALAGGARALKQPGRPDIGQLEVGCAADLISLDATHPSLVGHGPRTLLDALVFAGGSGAVRDVMVGGEWVIRDRHHRLEESSLGAFGRTLSALIRAVEA